MTEQRQQPSGLVSLGRSNVLVPRMGLGAMVWGDMSTAPRWNPARRAYGPTSSIDEQREALEVSLAAGVNFLDTAAMYGRGASERRVGELSAGRDVVVATKFPLRVFARARSLPAMLDGSLARLRRICIDLYQVHYPWRWMSIPTLMQLMADAVDDGRIRAVGVSNYNANQMRLAHAELAGRGVPLASNQVQYSLLHRHPETDGVLDACRELGVTLIAYMPLASGALTGKYSAARRPAGWRRYAPHFRGKNAQTLPQLIDVLREIGERHDRTPSQIALRWLMQQQGVIPIPGAKNGKQAAQNVGALTFSLEDAEMATLSEMTRAFAHS
jgi:aryl-alcohol dehydrogenase-like predicted oxidoreductase